MAKRRSEAERLAAERAELAVKTAKNQRAGSVLAIRELLLDVQAKACDGVLDVDVFVNEGGPEGFNEPAWMTTLRNHVEAVRAADKVIGGEL